MLWNCVAMKEAISKEFMDFSQCDITLCLIPFYCLQTNKLCNLSVLVYWEPSLYLWYTYISWHVVEAIALTEIQNQLLLLHSHWLWFHRKESASARDRVRARGRQSSRRAWGRGGRELPKGTAGPARPRGSSESVPLSTTRRGKGG